LLKAIVNVVNHAGLADSSAVSSVMSSPVSTSRPMARNTAVAKATNQRHKARTLRRLIRERQTLA
jgi:hypothetical protein